MNTDEETPKMRADARRSHARLIEAATVAFTENGADAPLDDIARRAGVGIGTLYRHFPTRLELQAAVYRTQLETLCATADDMIATVPAGAAFPGFLRAMAVYLTTKRGLSRTLIESLGKDSELISGCWLAMHDATDRLLAYAQGAGVVRDDIASDDVLRLVHAVVMACERTPGDTERLLSLMLDGLRPQLSPGGATPPTPRGVPDREAISSGGRPVNAQAGQPDPS